MDTCKLLCHMLLSKFVCTSMLSRYLENQNILLLQSTIQAYMKWRLRLRHLK